MSTFIDLDSVWRDREIYPNENSYFLGPKKIDTWFRTNRSITAFPQNPGKRPLEFVTTVNIKYLTIPYTEELADMPRVYVDFRSEKYKDVHLINSIEGRQMTPKFICSIDKIQSDSLDIPTWIHYRCNMEQTMRFERGDPVIFSITDRFGNTLPSQDTESPNDPDPLKQTLATFEITSYINDASYDHHLAEPVNF